MKKSSNKPTASQQRVLENLAAGLSATAHLHGRSAFGGYTGTRASLFARGWIDGQGITAAGRSAIGMPLEPGDILDQGAAEMLRAAVNLARQLQTRDVATLRQALLRSFADREVDIDRAIQYWANDVASRCHAGLSLS